MSIRAMVRPILTSTLTSTLLCFGSVSYTHLTLPTIYSV